jgi:cytochrome c-type biogenesis protein CcmH
MNTFIAAAAVLTLATLAIALRPLLANAFAPAQRRTFVSLLVVLPAAAVGLYAVLGERIALDPAHAAAQSAADPQVERMVAGLAARLEREPSDTKGWLMLARSYKAMGRLRDAEAAYDRAAPAIGGDAQELASYADVAASNAGGHFAGKPGQLIEQALRADPQNVMALWLAGAAALEGGDTRAGVAIWRKLLALLPPDSDDARELAGQIAQAGGTVLAVAAANPAAAVSGRVELAAGLQAPPDATVFIVARIPGQRAPVAVVRTTVAQLPFAFTLDDSRAMNPELRISSLREVILDARVSKSGGTTAQPDDLVAEAQQAAIGATGAVLRISHTRAQ